MYTVFDGVYHTPLGRFAMLDFSTTTGVPTPNDESSDSSWRNVSNADLFAPTLLQLWISTIENRLRGV